MIRPKLDISSDYELSHILFTLSCDTFLKDNLVRNSYSEIRTNTSDQCPLLSIESASNSKKLAKTIGRKITARETSFHDIKQTHVVPCPERCRT